MRKRFMGKRLAAALLAAAVAFSSGNFAGEYEYVYAAEKAQAFDIKVTAHKLHELYKLEERI